MLDQFIMVPLNERIEDIAIYDTSSALLTADVVKTSDF